MLRDLKIFSVFFVKVTCSVIAFVSVVITIYTVGPPLETKFWPVVDKLKILSMKAVDGNRTEIHAAFKKLRQCDYIGISWYAGDRPNDFERVPVILMRVTGDDSDPNRPVGYQRSGPWIISLTPEEVEKNSFARLAHRCHAFWTTITEFYP